MLAVPIREVKQTLPNVEKAWSKKEIPMISFLPITQENATTLLPYLAAQKFKTCDYSLGAIYQWRAYFQSSFAIVEGMLVLFGCYPMEGCGYLYPVGNGDVDKALAAIEKDALERDVTLRFCAVPDEGLERLKARFGDRLEIEERRDWADYLYEAQSLVTFAGKKLHGQRNHLNRFKKEYPSYQYIPVTAKTLKTAVAFLDGYEKHTSMDKPIEQEEMLRAKELLRDCLMFSLPAGYVTVDDTVVALAVGEIVADTLYVHVEKARLDYPGAYQAIVSEYAKNTLHEDTRFINREDDSGEEGLRTSKLAYQPLALLNKYFVTVKRA